MYVHERYMAYLTLCIVTVWSVTRHQFLSQKLLCRVPLDILSDPPFLVKRAKKKPGLHPGSCSKIYHTLKNYKVRQ